MPESGAPFVGNNVPKHAAVPPDPVTAPLPRENVGREEQKGGRDREYEPDGDPEKAAFE